MDEGKCGSSAYGSDSGAAGNSDGVGKVGAEDSESGSDAGDDVSRDSGCGSGGSAAGAD